MRTISPYITWFIALFFSCPIYAQSIIIDNVDMIVENGIRLKIENILISGVDADFELDDQITLSGNWITELNARLVFGPNAFVLFDGEYTQQIKSESNSFCSIEINNTNGNYDYTTSVFDNDIELLDNLTISNGSFLTMTNGIINTASSELRLNKPIAIIGCNSTKFIDGTLSYTDVSSDDGNLFFPVGDIQDRMLSDDAIPPACMKHVLYSPISIFLDDRIDTKLDVTYHYEKSAFWCWNPSCFSGSIHHISNLEYWQVNKSTNEISDIQLHYVNNTDLHQKNSHGFAYNISSYDESKISAAIWDNNSSWIDLGHSNSGNYTTGYFANNNSFPVGLGNSLNLTYASYNLETPLPIELLNFNASCYSDYVELYWETASETNNDRFIIEKSIDGINFISIGEISGAGNSNVSVSYSFIDDNAVYGYYRLRQIDYNGQESTANSIFADCNSLYNISKVDVYPNPSEGIVNLVGVGMPGESTNVYITDVLGRIIFSSVLENSSNNFSQTIDLSNQASAMYFVKIISGTYYKTFKLDIK